MSIFDTLSTSQRVALGISLSRGSYGFANDQGLTIENLSEDMVSLPHQPKGSQPMHELEVYGPKGGQPFWFRAAIMGVCLVFAPDSNDQLLPFWTASGLWLGPREGWDPQLTLDPTRGFKFWSITEAYSSRIADGLIQFARQGPPRIR